MLICRARERVFVVADGVQLARLLVIGQQTACGRPGHLLVRMLIGCARLRCGRHSGRLLPVRVVVMVMMVRVERLVVMVVAVSHTVRERQVMMVLVVVVQLVVVMVTDAGGRNRLSRNHLVVGICCRIETRSERSLLLMLVLVMLLKLLLLGLLILLGLAKGSRIADWRWVGVGALAKVMIGVAVRLLQQPAVHGGSRDGSFSRR